jgi:hypothetical protein
MIFTGQVDGRGRRVVRVDGETLPLPALNRDEARHSPDGFNWGYGGSGPAELARAILIAVAPGDPVVRLPSCYQRFKFDVVAGLGDTWRLWEESIRFWLQVWKGTTCLSRARGITLFCVNPIVIFIKYKHVIKPI